MRTAQRDWRNIPNFHTEKRFRISKSSCSGIYQTLGKSSRCTLADPRFLTVSDRFIRELSRYAAAPTKETEAKIEHLLKGMRRLKLKVYPEEELEMSSEFIQAIAGFFANTHGQYLKYAYAETLIHLLHPVIETATAEVNHPMWSKAIAVILQRASGMLAKPRYWSIGFSLFVVTLGVSPREVFMQNWQVCIDHVQRGFKVSHMAGIALTSGSILSSCCHGRFRPPSLDLPQSMYRILYLDA
jgi:hypothetical protein